MASIERASWRWRGLVGRSTRRTRVPGCARRWPRVHVRYGPDSDAAVCTKLGRASAACVRAWESGELQWYRRVSATALGRAVRRAGAHAPAAGATCWRPASLCWAGRDGPARQIVLTIVAYRPEDLALTTGRMRSESIDVVNRRARACFLNVCS